MRYAGMETSGIFKHHKGLDVLSMALLLALILCGAAKTAFTQDDQYQFDVEEYSKKTFSLGGYFEIRPSVSSLRRDSSFYRLQYYNRDKRLTAGEGYFGLLSDLTYQKGIFEAVLEPYIDFTASPLETEFSASLFQGYVLLKPSVSLTLYAGKRTLRWGKGYAWTPTAFAERHKNPNEPDLAREGYWMIAADYTLSFKGSLKTISFSPVLIPVSRSINDDFSRDSGFNIAGRLYLLFLDTDIDLVVLMGKSQSLRYGLDFSRNLRTNWEIHGEIAYIKNMELTKTDESGRITTETSDVTRYLLGLRYLSKSETTTILEYYHNGSGFDALGMKAFHSFVDSAYGAYLNFGDESLLQMANGLGTYSGFSPMRDYLFLRVSRKDPFNILYLTPAANVIWNLADGSASLIPEVMYKGFTNIELRMRAALLMGGQMEEFGEKPARVRFELRARLYF